MSRAAFSLGMMLCLGALSRSAHADVSVEACSDAYTKGQEERLAGRLFSARGQFAICSDSTCPGAIVRDCKQWQGEVDADLPTVVVKATDSAGNPVDSLSVSVDGASVRAEDLARPIVLDAGPHQVRFEAPGYDPAQINAALRPEDRNVPVNVVLHRASLSPPAVSENASTEPIVTSSAPRATPVLAITLAGVGVVALGSSLYFGLSAKNQYDELKSSCAPGCTQAQADSVHSKAVVSDVALGVAVVAFGAAAWLYLSSDQDKPQATALGIEPELGGARARLRITF
jgi:hypothetical protein